MNALHTSSAIVSELSCCHSVRALGGVKHFLMSARLVAKKKKPYSPAYLAHEPPHEPWPLHETVLVIARDGMHGEYDRLGTIPLGTHCHRIMCQNPSPGAIRRRQNRLQRLVAHTNLRISCDSCQSSCIYAAPSASGGSNEANDPSGARNSHMGDEPLKFIGYAHSGAVIGTDKRDRAMAYKGRANGKSGPRT